MLGIRALNDVLHMLDWEHSILSNKSLVCKDFTCSLRCSSLRCIVNDMSQNSKDGNH